MAQAAVGDEGTAPKSFTIGEIRIDGLTRIEAGTVLGALPLRSGDRYDSERGIQAIRSLFATGLFRDVRLQAEGSTLVIVVDERPAVAEVQLSGVKVFEAEAIRKSLREVGLAEGRVLDRSLLHRTEQELKKQYLGRGYYDVTVTITQTPLERNRVAVSIAVTEREPAHIGAIRFTGNHAFSDDELREQLALTASGWFTWYTKSDQYSREKLSGDLETLRSFYLARGYLEFGIESTTVAISQDKTEIRIGVNLIEGERYTLSRIELGGEVLGLRDEFTSMIDVRVGQIYNGDQMSQIAKRIGDRLSSLGYPFAGVQSVPTLDRERRQVAVELMVDPGRRSYVRRVEVAGNLHTRDEVIRREIRQYETALFDADKVRLSRDRIDRLGFFEQVEVETHPVPGSGDQVDVTYRVKERPLGTISAGAGYSSTEHLVLQGSYTQKNLWGSGQSGSVEINTSRATRTLSLSHTDPYVNDDGISRTVEVSTTRSELARLNLGTVDVETRRLGTTFGLPLTETTTVYLGARFERTGLGVNYCPDDYTDPYNPVAASNCTRSPTRYLEYVHEFGETSRALALTLGWGQDSRDNLLAPNSGTASRLTAEVGTPLMDVTYYLLTYRHQTYWPLPRRFTLAASLNLGYGGGYGGRSLPVFKNFTAGGQGSVRGYDTNTLGPRDSAGNVLGGTRLLTGSLEALMPLPGADRTLRMLAFYDLGQVWGDGDKLRGADLRMSAGLGISWLSPVGPLKLSYAVPLRWRLGDQTQRFQFQIGTTF